MSNNPQLFVENYFLEFFCSHKIALLASYIYFLLSSFLDIPQHPSCPFQPPTPQTNYEQAYWECPCLLIGDSQGEAGNGLME